jgi:hypothetical protein
MPYSYLIVEVVEVTGHEDVDVPHDFENIQTLETSMTGLNQR